MVTNHEIRFDCSEEEKEKVDNFYKVTSPELKKSAFYKRVFFWGVLQLKNQAMKGNDKDIVLKIFK